MKKVKEKTLKTKLDALYSTYIRKNAADDNGYITCYCGVKVHWKESDNSHYIPRGNLALRYDTKNTHPSCRRCNRFMGGNLQAYSLYLQRKYGKDILEELDREKRKTIRYFPYEEQIELYKEKLKKLEHVS